MQENVQLTSVKPRGNQAARWLVLIGGVINPIVFVVIYTVAGILRPGYSPIHQAISDLGVGPNGWLMDTIAVLHALLLIAFAMGFALLMRRVLTLGWLWVGTAFLVVRGLAQVTTCIGYLVHPSEKETLWAVITNLLLSVSWNSAIEKAEESFSITRENTGVGTANHQERHPKAP
jgi:Protein of unknown function (DUF998)